MDALRNALGRVIEFLPALVAGLVILVVGYLIAYAVRRLVEPALHRLGFDAFLARRGIVRTSPQRRSGSYGVAVAAFWVVLLAALMQTARAWRLGTVADGIARVLAYVPNLIAGVAIFAAALAIGNWVHDQMIGRTATGRRDRVAPGAIRAAILTLGAFMALQQLQLAPQIVTIAFTLALGTIAVATALSFGLGGRHTAERVTKDWYEGGELRTEKRYEAKPSETTTEPEPPLHH